MVEDAPRAVRRRRDTEIQSGSSIFFVWFWPRLLPDRFFSFPTLSAIYLQFFCGRNLSLLLLSLLLYEWRVNIFIDGSLKASASGLVSPGLIGATTRIR